MAYQAKNNASSSASKKPSPKKRASKTAVSEEGQTPQLERIAKVMARAGVASRRESERLIEQGRVSVNGKKITSPALNVGPTDTILVNGRPLPDREPTQIWRFHKPRGCVTTHKDPEGRELAFDHLPSDMARVISVGRLDYNTEGLLLLTNDGGLARYLELPATGWLRRYRVRVRGSITQHKLDELKDGITVDGVRYGRIDAQLNRQDKANLWITVSIREGKNREIRRIFESLGMAVSRLIRISYGPFMLGDLASGSIEAIKPKILIEQLGEDVAQSLGIPLDDDEAKKPRRRVRKEEGIDNALKSKKPGSPKGGRSLNFSGKRKFTDRNGRDGETSEKRQRTGRRSRNSSRALEARNQSREERRSENRHGREDRQDQPRNGHNDRRSAPYNADSRRSSQGRNRDERNGRDSRDTETSDKRPHTGRRSRNSSRALEARNQSREERRSENRYGREDRQDQPRDGRNGRRSAPHNADSRRSSQGRNRDDRNSRDGRDGEKPSYAKRRTVRGARSDEREGQDTRRKPTVRKTGLKKDRFKK